MAPDAPAPAADTLARGVGAISLGPPLASTPSSQQRELVTNRITAWPQTSHGHGLYDGYRVCVMPCTDMLDYNAEVLIVLAPSMAPIDTKEQPPKVYNLQLDFVVFFCFELSLDLLRVNCCSCLFDTSLSLIYCVSRLDDRQHSGWREPVTRVL